MRATMKPPGVDRFPAILVVVTMAALVMSASALAQRAPEAESVAGYVEGVPGGVMINTFEVSARVTDIDHFNRMATLEKADGESVTIQVGPEAVNFEQIEVGDVVVVTIAEELVVHLGEPGQSTAGGSAAIGVFGAQAGGMAEFVNEIVGTVKAIDQDARSVTLQFPDGTEETFPVRPDIDLALHGVGEQVVFRSTEMVAVNIEKPSD